MAKYELRIKKSAAKELEAVSRKADRQRLVQQIQSLADNPRPPGCKKLSGSNKYRIRQGNYRIVYSVEDDKLVVYVVKIGDRKDIYKPL